MRRNESDIWFPAKRYGWGWGPPRTWQGWIATAAYVAILLIGVFTIDPERQTTLFIGWMMTWSVAFIALCWWKGEKPRWRWGGKG